MKQRTDAKDYGVCILDLPYPPTLNHLHAVVHGRKVLSAEGRKYKQCAMYLTSMVFADRCSVKLTVQQPDKRRRDLDNTIKPVLDALVFAGILIDDSLIDQLVVARGYSRDNPGVRVEIRSWVR